MGTITIIVQSSHVIQICVTYPQGAKELTFYIVNRTPEKQS